MSIERLFMGEGSVNVHCAKLPDCWLLWQTDCLMSGTLQFPWPRH